MISRLTPTRWIAVFLLFAGLLWCGYAFAAEAPRVVYDTLLSRGLAYLKTHYTRATWDELMMWVNFLILAGLIIKYARTPMANFLKGKKAETARLIQRMEERKREAEEKIREGRAQLQDSRIQLDTIMERIVSEGRRRKAQMIEDAQLESRILMEATRTRIDYQIQDTYRIIRAELIDAAVDKTMVKLPKVVTEQDHERMIGLWMEEALR